MTDAREVIAKAIRGVRTWELNLRGMGAGAEKLRSDIQTIIAEVERLQILERKAADAIAHAKATEWQRQTASGARIAALRDVESALIGVDFRKAKKADVIEVVRLLAEDARLASPP